MKLKLPVAIAAAFIALVAPAPSASAATFAQQGALVCGTPSAVESAWSAIADIQPGMELSSILKAYDCGLTHQPYSFVVAKSYGHVIGGLLFVDGSVVMKVFVLDTQLFRQ